MAWIQTTARRTVIASCIALVLCAVSASSAFAAERGCQSWCGPGASELKLIDTRYEVDVFGALALGSLVLEYAYDGREPIEASYVHPRKASIRAQRLELSIDGEVHEISAKREKTAPTRRRGRSAAAPAPKTVTIEPGQSVEVRAGFQMNLLVEEGLFTLHLPAWAKAAGQGDDLADMISPSLQLRVHHEQPLGVAESSTHEIFAAYEGQRTAVELVDGLGNRRFELRFSIGPDDESTLLSYVGRQKEGTREVVTVLTPPSRRADEAVRPKRVVFVLDSSGSMAKDGKIDQARAALYASLEKLGPQDRYNIIEFNYRHVLFQEEPVSTEQAPIAGAAEWLAKRRAASSTQLLPALSAAFAQPQDEQRHAMIVILSDGAVQDPRGVERLLERKLGEARLFVVGIGKDVKRENIQRFAEIGRGEAAIATDPEEVRQAVSRLFNSVSEPLAWDLELDWGGADVEVIRPQRLPDLYAGRAVTVFARVRGELPSVVRIHGTTMDGTRTYSATIPAEEIERLPGAGR